MHAMLLIAITLCSWSVLFAQDKKPPTKNDDEVIRVDTELVEVPVVITDRTGKPILDLKQSNFVVSEDGKPQQITDFSTSSAPFEVALLLDTSGSTRGELQLMQRAAQNFISSLRPGDRVSIIAYQTDTADGKASPKSELIVNLTSDRTVLSTALARIKTSTGTPYYDSLVQVVETVFRVAA